MMNKIHNVWTTPHRTGAGGAFERLFELAALLGELMDRGLTERGLTRARATVVWLLSRHGAVTQRELSEVLRVTPRNVTGLVDALEADGFVERRPHPNDRRATLVTLTDRGQTTAAALQSELEEGAKGLFDGVSDEELARFVATLDHVLERLRDGDAATSRQSR